jgi:hypothetical protein
MPRTRTEDGKRVSVGLKVSEGKAAEIDAACAAEGVTRAEWVAVAIDMRLGTVPVLVKRTREKAPKAAARVADPVEALPVPPAPEVPAEPPQAVFSGPVARTAADVAAQLETVRRSGHALNCKCFTCKPPAVKK